MDQGAGRGRRQAELERRIEPYLGYLREGVEGGLAEIYLNRIADAERELISLRAARAKALGERR